MIILQLTPLFVALREGNVDVVKVLIKHGADVNGTFRDIDGGEVCNGFA